MQGLHQGAGNLVVAVMTERNDPLAPLRAKIDQLDDSLHDLFMQRAEIVREIADVKAAQTGSAGPVFAMRPGREASILRRLASRHSGELPYQVVGRIWRELIAAKCRMQGPFQVAIFGSSDIVGYWDVARSHFGSDTPMVMCDTVRLVLQKVANETGIVGVLPTPGCGDSGTDWWQGLAHGSAGNRAGPQIVARLPFFRSGLKPERDAVAIANVDREETGEDRTYLVLHGPANISRASCLKTIDAVGISAQLVGWQSDAESVLLLDADGYIADDDPRLIAARQAAAGAIAHISVIGGYAVPYHLPG